jgi:hypothetical protein
VYKLQFQQGRELVSTTTYMGELLHRRMAHLHFGVLGHLSQAVIGLPKFITERHALAKVVQWASMLGDHFHRASIDPREYWT